MVGAAYAVVGAAYAVVGAAAYAAGAATPPRPALNSLRVMTLKLTAPTDTEDQIFPDSPTLAFFLKKRETPKRTRVFLFAEPLKSLEKKGKTHKESKGNRKK